MPTQCQILSESEKKTIHKQSIRILEEIGVAFHSPKARQILKKHGARVDDETGITRIPDELVEQALASAPKSFTLGSRVPKKDFRLPSPQPLPRVGAGLSCPTSRNILAGAGRMEASSRARPHSRIPHSAFRITAAPARSPRPAPWRGTAPAIPPRAGAGPARPRCSRS